MTRAEHDAVLAGAWAAFAAEAEVLLATDPDAMTPEEQERLDTLSDPLIHLVGHAESSRPRPTSSGSPRFVEYLALERGRRWSHRSALGESERQVLRDRILAGLHADRLRVREVAGVPPLRRRAAARRADPELLAEAERRHEAVVPDLAIAAGAGRELYDAECDATIPLPADVPRGRYVALKVSGDSMEPLMHSGDLVLVKLGARPTPGTVVVARDPDHGYVVKEVGRVTSRAIELLSLNAAYPPLRVPHAAETVLGMVILRWRPSEPRSPRLTAS
jgi:SOS-response transcriptional repressor LexA